MKTGELREPLLWFASHMEVKLRNNDKERGPRGWDNDEIWHLSARLPEEWKEAVDSISDLLSLVSSGSSPEIVAEASSTAIFELADVANFAMMMADRIRISHPPKGLGVLDGD